jgi:hypothetical protein
VRREERQRRREEIPPGEDMVSQPLLGTGVAEDARPPPSVSHPAAQPVAHEAGDQFRVVRE